MRSVSYARSRRSLDRIVPLGEGHLREVIREYRVNYHEERTTRGSGIA